MLLKTVALAVLCLTISACETLADPALIEKGRMIAKENCQRCHSITRKGKSPFTKAPPFRVIARIYKASDIEEALVEGIVVGHPAMPEFQMSPDQAHALTTYIDSLSRSK